MISANADDLWHVFIASVTFFLRFNLICVEKSMQMFTSARITTWVKYFKHTICLTIKVFQWSRGEKKGKKMSVWCGIMMRIKGGIGRNYWLGSALVLRSLGWFVSRNICLVVTYQNLYNVSFFSLTHKILISSFCVNAQQKLNLLEAEHFFFYLLLYCLYIPRLNRS